MSFMSDLFSKPVCFQAAAQRHPGTMQHHPQIALRDTQQLANLLALDAVHFAHREDGRDVFWQLPGAIVKGPPERFAVEARSGIGGPLERAQFVNPAILEKSVGNETVAFL